MTKYKFFPPGTLIYLTPSKIGDMTMSWLILQSISIDSSGLTLDERGEFSSALFEKSAIKVVCLV